MDLIDEASGVHRDECTTTAAAITLSDGTEPTTEDRERVYDKTTEVTAPTVTNDDDRAAADDQTNSTLNGELAATSVEQEEADDDDDKTTEVAAAVVAVAADQETADTGIPCDRPIVVVDARLPIPPPSSRRSRPVITPCVNLNKMRRSERNMWLRATFAEGKWTYSGEDDDDDDDDDDNDDDQTTTTTTSTTTLAAASTAVTITTAAVITTTAVMTISTAATTISTTAMTISTASNVTILPAMTITIDEALASLSAANKNSNVTPGFASTSILAPTKHRWEKSKPIFTQLLPFDGSCINTFPSSTSPPTDWDLTIYENRLRTYRNDWVLTFVTPRQMAKAGFYFLGKQDAVRCPFCSSEFAYWVENEDPYQRHKVSSPGCPYLTQNLTYDVCGIFESLPDHHIPGNEVNMIHFFLKSVGIEHQVKVLNHNKTLTSYESRFRTFDKCLTRKNLDIFTLCKAGYYSTGTSDETICFCCNQGLKEWESHDDPWVEHARWSPTCSFVLLSKGKHFVEGVGGEVSHNLNVDMDELCKLVTIHKKTSIQNYNAASSSMESRLTTSLNKTDHRILKNMVPDFNQCITEQHPSTLPDSMLCKICYKEKLEVLFMPCGHIISCIQCAVTIEQCAVCRLPFAISMRVYIYPVDKVLLHLNNLSPSDPFGEEIENMPCKVCRKKDLELVFMPCMHACTCFDCGEKMIECPVCYEKVYAFIKVFI